MKLEKIFLILFSAILFAACSSLKLEPAQFGWPIESVLKINNDGFVKEERHSINFNTKAMFLEETGDTLSYAGKSIRMIRNNEGYYFITAVDFKNVYVFSVDENAFVLKSKIEINDAGLQNPAFNQRSQFIELIDSGITYKLTSGGIEDSGQ